jgi:hypothetical protein
MPHGQAKEGGQFELRQLALVGMIANHDDPLWDVVGTVSFRSNV